ncbi:hypothetical protein MMC18_003150 [Xylographa bjoerkii]|nr:hypothetical protein [Xylographa bjoerkii]
MACCDELLSMVPVRDRKRKTQVKEDGEVWQNIYILANLFSSEEWPSQEPASLEALSIGEEQSASIVTAIAWSPAGLAKHKRSILAVLTSNLLLSLWDPGSNSSEASSWSRATIVNDYLQAHFQVYNSTLDVSRKRRRIRTICWAKELPKDIQAAQRCGQLLAVLNDNDEVIVFDISSPYTCKQEGWAAKVLSHNSITSKSHKLHTSGHEIVWSSWATKSDSVDALVSCKIDTERSTFRISIKTSVVHDIRKDSTGPIPQSPKVITTLGEGDYFPELAGPEHSMLCDSKCYLSRPSWDVISGEKPILRDISRTGLQV